MYVTGELVTNNAWLESQPRLRSGLACVVAVRQLVEGGYRVMWDARDCGETHDFICQIGKCFFFNYLILFVQYAGRM